LQAAGILMPPVVSVPKEKGTIPEATIAADAPLDPPVVLSKS